MSTQPGNPRPGDRLRDLSGLGLRYGTAVFLTGTAALVEKLLGPAIVPSAFLAAYAAVLATALIGGLGPGLLSVALSAIVDGYLFLPRENPTSFIRVGLFVLVAVAVCWVAARVRTSRRRMVEAERRYRRLFDSDLLGIVFWNSDGRITAANDRFLDVIGYSRAEFAAGTLRWTDITPPEYARTDAERLAQLRATGMMVPFEKEYFRKDGSRVPIIVGGTTFVDGGDEGVAFVVDITERKRAEAALREANADLERRVAERTAELRRSEDRYRLVSELTSDFAYCVRVDPTGFPTFEWVAGALSRISGLAPDELSATGLLALIHPDDIGIVSDRAHRLMSGASSVDEYRIRTRNGEVCWLRDYGRPVCNEEDDQVTRVLGAAQDISARKQAEEALRASEERFQSAFRDAPNGMALVDLEGHAFRVNQSLCAVLGYSESELLTTPMRRLIHPDDLTDALDAYRRLVAGEVDAYQIEPRYFHKSGKLIFTEVHVSVVHDPDGRPLHSIAHVRDVTEEHYLSRVLGALSARLEVKDSFREVASNLRALTECDRCTVILFDERNEWATVWPLDGSTSDLPMGARVRIAESPALPNVLGGRAHLVPDLADELGAPIVETVYRSGLRSALSLPLAGTTRVAGMLVLTWQRVGACNQARLPVLRQVTDAVALAFEKNRLFDEVRTGRERLKTLSRELMRVQEVERRHLATELHDEIGQTLTGIKLMLDTIERSPPAVASARLAQAQALTNVLVTQVRNLSLDLRPAMLDDLGLLPSLLWLFGRYSSQTKVDVAFEHHGLDGRFAPELETTAFRIVQEALTNVARHAGVATVRVTATGNAAALVMEIADDGCGFDPVTEPAAGASAGIMGMRERAARLGGQLIIKSAPGAGTYVCAQLPLRDDGRESLDERDDLRSR